MTSELNALKQSHHLLHNHLMQTQDSYQWRAALYKLAPDCYYHVEGTITGPLDRRYVAVSVCDESYFEQIIAPPSNIAPHDEVTIRNFSSLCRYAIEYQAGIAFIKSAEESVPLGLLRYGSVWSYLQYQELAGPANIISDFEQALSLDPDYPLTVEKSNTDKYLVSGPSEEFFPSYVRNLIFSEVKELYSNASPSINLIDEPRYAVHYSIMVSLGIEISDQEKAELQEKLSWYMPPYLPIMVR